VRSRKGSAKRSGCNERPRTADRIPYVNQPATRTHLNAEELAVRLVEVPLQYFPPEATDIGKKPIDWWLLLWIGIAALMAGDPSLLYGALAPVARSRYAPRRAYLVLCCRVAALG